MDKLAHMLGGSGSGSGQTQTTNNGQKEDYLDKALDAVEKKTGHVLSRDTNEKITDKARELFEKSTGKHVPEKFSN